MREREEIQKVLRGISEGPEPSHQEPRRVTIAGIQCTAGKNRDDNLKRLLQFARTAVDRGARLLFFPECFSLPWMHMMPASDYRDYAESIPGPSTRPFIELAAAHDAWCFCPVYEQNGMDRFFSTVIIGPGGVHGVYRKIQPAAKPYWEETSLAAPGNDLPLFDLGFVKIGVLMGWDCFFPEAARILALKGAELLFVPTASAMASQKRWFHVLTGHSVCNGYFVVRVNRCGSEAELGFYGESFCVDPFGEPVTQPTFHKDALLVADIDLNEVSLARCEFSFMEERRPGLYGLIAVSRDTDEG